MIIKIHSNIILDGKQINCKQMYLQATVSWTCDEYSVLILFMEYTVFSELFLFLKFWVIKELSIHARVFTPVII